MGTAIEVHYFSTHLPHIWAYNNILKSYTWVRTITCCSIYKHLINFHRLSVKHFPITVSQLDRSLLGEGFRGNFCTYTNKDEPQKPSAELRQTQKTTCSMILYLWNVQYRKIHTDRTQISDRQGLGERASLEWLLTGMGLPSWVIKMFWNWLWWRLHSSINIFLNNHWIGHFKCVTWMVCEFYLLKAIVYEIHYKVSE